MKFVRQAAVAAMFAAMALAPAANAAGLSDCTHMAKQVAQALETAQPGAATEAARANAKAGRDFCASSMYAQGVVHYSKALQLLGKG